VTKRAFLAAPILAFAFALGASPASAQGRDANQRALKVAYEADDLYARGQWGPAYERFAEADTLAHSPVFVLYMARCRKNAGRLLEAQAIYARLADESVPADAPKPFRDARASAAAERDEVARRVPRARVAIEGAEGAPAALRVDGKDVPAGGAPMPLDPGMHAFDASSGAQTAHKDVLLADGAGEVPIVLSFVREAHDDLPPPAARGSAVPAIVVLSVAGVALGVGAVTGAMAMNKANAVKAGCVDGHCLRSDGNSLDAAKSLARISTIAFVVAGVGAAAGATLLVWRPAGGATAIATIGPGSVAVGATF
jgi:hypothetical protein